MKALFRILSLNLAIGLLLGILALALVEGWLRLAIPASSSDSIFEYTLQTERYKVMRPNAEVMAWGVPLRTNDLGFRDERPYGVAKRPGEYRVVVIGDSFTVSAGVEQQRLYTSLLEQRLKAQHPDVRVFNLAVAGYNVVQYAMLLKEVALPLDPDMVVVALFPTNDFSNETYADNRERALGAPPPPAPPWHEQLYVYQAYLGRVEARVRGWLAPAGAAKGPAQDPALAAWGENIAALDELAQEVRARDIVLGVVVLPHTWNFERQRPLHQQVDAHCRARGLSCLGLLERFIAAGVRESTLRLNPLDSHPNAAYNALVAQEVAPLVEQHLAPHAAATLAADQ